jgi:hypothetical protein
MTFRVGQKVICVGYRNPQFPLSDPAFKLTKGASYTIRDIDTRFISMHGVMTIRVEEVVRPSENCAFGPWEPGYHPLCFRPVAEKKTDISIFTQLLRPTPESRELVSSVNGEGINAR